ncbi:MAG: lipocalin family protein [Paracoccaceae bacterium]|nr:lipocalin family protein [Paracoccaceae bacterium]
MRALVAALFLAGCAATPDPLTDVTIPLRNPTAPVASQADVTLDRLQGDWRVVSGSGITPGARLQIRGAQMVIDGVVLALTDDGEGRLKLSDETLWVHWLDIGNRTAAVGDPAGSRVWIMDRTGAPRERLKAAREILDWYGYDLSRMEAA